MNLALMWLIDRQFLETPFYGVGQMTWHLRNGGHAVNVKRIRRLMRLMRLTPIYQKPNTSKPAKPHKTFPYASTCTLGRPARRPKAGVGRWIACYKHQRTHVAHGGRTPAVGYFNQIETDQQGQRVA
jgi:hypothetical protein